MSGWTPFYCFHMWNSAVNKLWGYLFFRNPEDVPDSLWGSWRRSVWLWEPAAGFLYTWSRLQHNRAYTHTSPLKQHMRINMLLIHNQIIRITQRTFGLWWHTCYITLLYNNLSHLCLFSKVRTVWCQVLKIMFAKNNTEIYNPPLTLHPVAEGVPGLAQVFADAVVHDAHMAKATFRIWVGGGVRHLSPVQPTSRAHV